MDNPSDRQDPSSRRPARRSRSSDPDGRGREERKCEGATGRERGRSEERKGTDGESRAKAWDMGEEGQECAVCFCAYDNVFKAPKVLSCGHTFCLECLARINVLSPELKSLTCPVCREQTRLPHGRDLPHLDNNKDIFSRLPPQMQRALSVRFQRSKGKLVLKKPAAPGMPAGTTLCLPNLAKKQQEHHAPPLRDEGQISTVELGLSPATTVDVGRPPSRVRGHLRQIIRSNQCYYAVVAAIIIVTVALMLVGILAFVVMPSTMAYKPSPEGNGTQKP